MGLLLDESLEWNVSFTAMQSQDKYLKKYLGGLIKWRDQKAIEEAREKRAKKLAELQIRCTGTRQKAKELSGGNQQKICLAKAFALEPELLIVSEPTRGIDVGAKALVLNALRRYNEEAGTTIIMVSSELEELRMTCDRIAIITDGKVAGILPATESSEEFGLLMVGAHEMMKETNDGGKGKDQGIHQFLRLAQTHNRRLPVPAFRDCSARRGQYHTEYFRCACTLRTEQHHGSGHGPDDPLRLRP